jgi:hypothetical protein
LEAATQVPSAKYLTLRFKHLQQYPSDARPILKTPWLQCRSTALQNPSETTPGCHIPSLALIAHPNNILLWQRLLEPQQSAGQHNLDIHTRGAGPMHGNSRIQHTRATAACASASQTTTQNMHPPKKPTQPPTAHLPSQCATLAIVPPTNTPSKSNHRTVHNCTAAAAARAAAAAAAAPIAAATISTNTVAAADAPAHQRRSC